jgi:hypothetical protein
MICSEISAMVEMILDRFAWQTNRYPLDQPLSSLVASIAPTEQPDCVRISTEAAASGSQNSGVDVASV